MSFNGSPELIRFLSTVIFESDTDSEAASVGVFIESASDDVRQKVVQGLQALAKDPGLSLGDLGTNSNRWFAEVAEARSWLESLLALLQSEDENPSATLFKVLDSNGTELAEGDSVMVIKDLNVKGGSSDLKRGAVIKKIHLVGDPEVIECRVGGSTLVLKTCFLKKA